MRLIKWTQSKINEANQYKRDGISARITAEQLAEKFSEHITRDMIKHVWQRHPLEDNHRSWNDDGVQTSETVLKVVTGQELTPIDVIKAHGYDPSQWEIISNTSNFWKQSEGVTSYQSKIRLKPKTNVDLNEIAEIFNKSIAPVRVKNINSGGRNLVVPLFDLHFGIMDFDMYKDQLAEIIAIMSHGYKRIVIEQGGDLLHSDYMNKTQTVNGTQLDHVNMVKAIADAKRFYDELMTCALENALQVDVYSLGGNHDFDMDYMFVDALADRYSQADVHNTAGYRQAYRIDNVGIMVAHGDKAQKKLPMLFATEQPLIWSQVNYREIHYGHYHKEVTQDEYGVVMRQLGTPKLSDPYEVANGYTMASHKLQLFEYGFDRLKATYEI